MMKSGQKSSSWREIGRENDNDDGDCENDEDEDYGDSFLTNQKKFQLLLAKQRKFSSTFLPIRNKLQLFLCR